MQPSVFTLEFVSMEAFLVVIKIVVIFLEMFYVVFAFIMSRQLKLMNRSFHTPLAPTFALIAALHFWGSLALVAISILVLL
jgi:hypothetical protein